MSGIPDHYTPAQLADKLNVSEQFVKHKAHSGEWGTVRKTVCEGPA